MRFALLWVSQLYNARALSSDSDMGLLHWPGITCVHNCPCYSCYLWYCTCTACDLIDFYLAKTEIMHFIINIFKSIQMYSPLYCLRRFFPFLFPPYWNESDDDAVPLRRVHNVVSENKQRETVQQTTLWSFNYMVGKQGGVEAVLLGWTWSLSVTTVCLRGVKLMLITTVIHP